MQPSTTHYLSYEEADEDGKLTKNRIKITEETLEMVKQGGIKKYSRTCGNPIVIHYAFQLLEQNGMPALEQVMRPTQQTA